MASISDTLIQGLLQPSFGVPSFQEPIGMLLGGSQAKKAEEERQTNLLSQALDVQNPADLQGLVRQAKPNEIGSILEAVNAGTSIRKTQQATEREKAFREMVAREGATLGSEGQRLAEVANTEEYDTLRENWANLYKNFSSNPGILRTYDVPTAQWEDLINLPPKELISLLKGSRELGQATIKNYINQDGQIVTLATNKLGQVRSANNQWIPIEQSGLTIAPDRQQTSNMTQTLNDQIGEGAIKRLDKKLQRAESSVETYNQSLEAEAILPNLKDDDLGLFQDLAQLGREALISFGVAKPETIQTASDFKILNNNRLRAAISLLSSGAFGAAQSLTDKDREFAKQMAGGDSTWNKESLKKLLYLERKAAFFNIKAHNEDLNSRVGKIAPNAIPVYTVKPPVDTFYDQPGNYVDRFKAIEGDLRPEQYVYEDIFGVRRYADGTIEKNEVKEN
jgi:hypothetical protein